MSQHEIIQYNSGLMDFLQHFSLNCPNHPTNYTLTEVDQLKLNFCRYTKRIMYFASNFLRKYDRISDEIKERNNPSNEPYITMVTDDIFFEFDAFLFSCKSIVEGNSIKKAKGMNPHVYKEYLNFSKMAFETFIKTYLNPLRDEVVHINNFGSAMGSSVKVEEGKLFFRAFNYSDNMELRGVFDTILENMSTIIRSVATFFMQNDCLTHGYPLKDISFKSYGENFKISDFVEIQTKEDANN